MENVKIGLETHIQLNTNTKLFCGCPNEKTDEPNQNVCEICLGHPGSKPRVNEKVIENAIKAAEALNCEINKEIFFSRKTYFYPDMSKNYQITQYEIPIGEQGEIKFNVEDQTKSVGIQRIHIEEDPAKLRHEGQSISKSNYSLVDYNRAGTPLLEIVTKPQFKSPKQARKYLQQLAQIFEYLNLYEPESQFSIKSDANISLKGGARVEVKNITGTKGIEKALNYEISRQKQLQKRNRKVEQETRSYSSSQEITEKLREKEEEKDYGYIFDPDLTHQKITNKLREKIQEKIPELPQEKFERFKENYNISEKMVESLISEQKLADDYEQLVKEHEEKLTASWLTGELKKTLNYNEISYKKADIPREWLSYIIGLLEKEKVSDRNAEKIIRKMIGKNKDPRKIVEENDLLKEEDEEIGKYIQEAIEKNPEAVKDYNSGEEDALNYLVGQVMNISNGKVDPKEARNRIESELE